MTSLETTCKSCGSTRARDYKCDRCGITEHADDGDAPIGWGQMMNPPRLVVEIDGCRAYENVEGGGDLCLSCMKAFKAFWGTTEPR